MKLPAKRHWATALAGLGLTVVLVGALPTPASALGGTIDCIGVSGAGASLNADTYSLTVTNSCGMSSGRVYVNYIFSNGSYGFGAQTSGFVAVDIGAPLTFSLAGVPAGTYTSCVRQSGVRIPVSVSR